MKRKRARKILTEAVEDAIRIRMDVIQERQGNEERARLKVTGWTSPELRRLAAKAAVAVLEAGAEGERLQRVHGDA